MGIGSRIRDFRKRAKMTQAELAEAVGVSGQIVSRWERDVQEPAAPKLEAVAERLGVKVEDIAGITVYPDMSLHERQKLMDGLRSDTIYLLPIPAFSLRKNEDGVWTYAESSQLQVIPAVQSRFKARPLAVVTRGVNLNNVNIPEGSIVLVDSGSEIQPGGVSLVMMYGAPKFVQLYRAGASDYIVDDGASRERLDSDAQKDCNFDIVGPVVEIRTYL